MVMAKFDIGLVGWWYATNYGSVITYYALSLAINKFGYTTVLIDRPEKETDPEGEDVISRNFLNQHCNVSESVKWNHMNLLNDLCDTFVVGSDQVWTANAIRNMKYMFFLDFVGDDKKKIAYASSFGSSNFFETDREQEIQVQYYLSRFDRISVREDFGVKIVKERFRINADRNLDPVFLITQDDYSAISRESVVNTESKYALAYILDPTPDKENFIKVVSEKLGIEVKIILDGRKGTFLKNKEKFTYYGDESICSDVKVEDWIKLFRNSQYVLTDSHHGLAMAIIFEKNYICYANHSRGYERFTSFLSLLNMMDRMIDSSEQVNDKLINMPIDYLRVNSIISEERKKSLEWLREAIVKSKNELPSIVAPEAQMVGLLYQSSEFIKIRILATLLRDYGVKHVILSPGGRDVPLVRIFEYNEDSFILHRITDERSAAYYGMGIAVQLRQPVACICTSGTAASNYLPAVTEAYYTGVPLIVITADRQQVYLNQGEDQTIPQKRIYDGVIKKSVTLPESADYKAEYQTRRDISDCILEATHNVFGPVHINIAIDNISMGAKVPKEYWRLLPRINPHILRVGLNDGEKRMLQWVNELKKSERILVVYGQNPPLTEKQLKNIEKFASKYNCVIVTDFISNLDCAYSLQPYNMLQSISNDEFNKQLSPDILITVGGKRLMNDPLTFKIRGGLKNIRHWSVTPNGKVKDFYFRLTSVLEMSQDFFFEWFSSMAGDIINNGVFYNKWKEMTEKYSAPEIKGFNSHYVQSKFIPIVPENSLLHLGVGQSFIDSRRYSMKRNVEVFCNMGTNGIDGCTSTFLGQCAVIKERLCFLLVGDLSFFYDMNSIWNKELDKNVRILMVNNSGSGLLRGHNLKAITAMHNTSARGWVESVNFEYISASKEEEYDEKLRYFISDEPQKAVFFEVFCD